MPSVLELPASGADFATLRSAGREALSLALIETRNRTLRWLSALEGAGSAGPVERVGAAAALPAEATDPLAWTLGHLAWFQERWIGRNVQRSRGPRADPTAPPLPPLHAGVDAAYDPAESAPARRAALAAACLGDLAATRTHAVEILEQTLDLLGTVAEADDHDGQDSDDRDAAVDDALHFFRRALFHEAMQEEAFAVRAQAVGVDTGLVARPAAVAQRPPHVFPATRWLLGQGGRGFAFDHQPPPQPVQIPEFEIDSQAVSWAQYAEFVEDGGYDDGSHWSDDGRAWLAREGRRVPRHVEQIRHGVLQRRYGRTTRLPLASAVVHVTAFEAEAWCRWAGRRLPGEAEWEAAAHQGASRGFRWGEVREWTATTFRPRPGFVAGPWTQRSTPAMGRSRVLRGSSLATPAALVGARLRDFAEPDRDEGFFGFRSCAA